MIPRRRVFLIVLTLVLILAGLAVLSTSARGQTGMVRVAVIPIDYTGTDWSGAGTEASIRAAMAEALSIFTTASSGTATFPVLVGAPYRVTKIPGQCFEGYAAKAVQNSGLVADRWLFLTQDQGCRYGGEATLGGSIGYVNAGTASYVIAHELGHMLGLQHANSMNCIFPGNLLHCTFHEYGDPIDVMAGGSTVQARERATLGYPISFVNHLGGTSTYAMTDIDAGGYGLGVTRADGLTYAIELRPQGFFVRMSYTARMNYVATLRPGPDGINYSSVYRDVTGGVQLTAVDATHLLVERFTPPAPDPEPTAPPYATPRPPTTVTPDADCWVLKPYIRCTPTPTVTPTPIPATATPTRTATATPTDSPTATPTTVAPEATPVPPPAATPTSRPPVAKTPAPPVPRPKPKGGCGVFGLFSAVLTFGPMLEWKRRILRRQRRPRPPRAKPPRP